MGLHGASRGDTTRGWLPLENRRRVVQRVLGAFRTAVAVVTLGRPPRAR